ncbi:hypothetical protein CYMTET_52772 [Cymbomonas tetramitiformis]|uniref:AB hydrolase-1 domain-containing protein n=1 Tax=Cymbomonas tetramitiformis TaxID=36881 RepID=A0AAE0ESE3_9CHLO|nr:hypothetical protein CYMTET_52772 [Cymbomonas tetramitiformis]
MRWHIDLPSDAESAFMASFRICAKEIPSLPIMSKEELDKGNDLSRAAEASVKGVHSLRFQDVSTGMRLRYLLWGESERVIILLHGMGDSSGIFAGLGPRLASREYKVIAPDLRGHGDSSSSQEGQYTPQSLAQDLESFVTEQDLYVRPFALVGIGLGSVVALTYAERNPRLVACVVLAEFAPDISKDKLAYFYGQAGEFTDQAQAASFLSSRCWGHPPRSIPLVMKHISFRCRTLVRCRSPTAA